MIYDNEMTLAELKVSVLECPGYKYQTNVKNESRMMCK